MLRPLFLPKNVSLVAVMPCMPSELLFWKSTTNIATMAAMNNRAINISVNVI